MSGWVKPEQLVLNVVWVVSRLAVKIEFVFPVKPVCISQDAAFPEPTTYATELLSRLKENGILPVFERIGISTWTLSVAMSTVSTGPPRFCVENVGIPNSEPPWIFSTGIETWNGV